jgi:hypothetical protein
VNELPTELGWLEWVGDLDGDNQLDFQLSYFETNGGQQSSILFLSTSAVTNELVRPYAFYSAKNDRCW